jgi:hypothetical protein
MTGRFQLRILWLCHSVQCCATHRGLGAPAPIQHPIRSAQIPISERSTRGAHPSRGFLPWRLPDAGPVHVPASVMAGIRNPSQFLTFARALLYQRSNRSNVCPLEIPQIALGREQNEIIYIWVLQNALQSAPAYFRIRLNARKATGRWALGFYRTKVARSPSPLALPVTESTSML